VPLYLYMPSSGRLSRTRGEIGQYGPPPDLKSYGTMSAENSAAGSPRRGRRCLSADQVHGPERVREAIRELTQADLGRLHVAAKSLFGGAGIDRQGRDHQDLLSTAVARTLSGKRQWQKGVDFAWHLFQTMRSIASHWRRQALRAQEPILESLEDHPYLLDPRPDPETAFILRETVAAIYRHFTDDAAATVVLDCLAHGMDGPQVRQHTGMSQRELTTTVERIRRHARRGEPGR
jgi:DNA-directed RNA polymerase specialized sigma24 family protein